jgi:hypothetical protein
MKEVVQLSNAEPLWRNRKSVTFYFFVVQTLTFAFCFLSLSAAGEWLRDQNTMEDTITILQKEGWMA